MGLNSFQTSGNSPGSEGVANAIDNQPNKYLNFDKVNTGFTVTPNIGPSLVKALSLTSAKQLTSSLETLFRGNAQRMHMMFWARGNWFPM